MHDKAALNGIKKVVILGHSGFIGRHLDSYFRSHEPAVEVVGISIDTMDLTDAAASAPLRKLFDERTAVIMCSGIKRNFGDNLDNFSGNVGMVTNLCRILEEARPARLVYFSSAAVYGEDVENLNITEESSILPTTYYGMAKYVSERLLWKSLEKDGKSSLVVIRPTTVYGPGEGMMTYSPSGFARAALKKEEIVLWGDGSEKRDFVFVDDLVRMVHALAFNRFSGVLNVASGTSHTFREILSAVSEVTGTQVRTRNRERTKSKVDHGFNVSLLRSVLPEIKFTALEEGIRRTVDAAGRGGV